MGFFAGLSPGDHVGHFDALRQMAETNYGVTIPQAPHRRAEIWSWAEAVFKAPLGQEVRAFLGFIADVAASGTFETLAGDKGKMEPTDPCQYCLELTNLNGLDPSFEGISYMKTRDFESYFSILASKQGHSPCPTANYSLRKHKGKPELARSPYGDVSLISFTLDFFGQQVTEAGRALSSSAPDVAALQEEAYSCYGAPADLGGGVYYYEDENSALLIRPIADIGITLSIHDLRKHSPVSDRLLELIEGGTSAFKA
ncbi:hypothetical protein [Tsuneonella flava]|uniref:hypothetical protein n=1 Tax=Tsuneonella flava TaxID=2055955 RepID=UPI000F4C1A82|nr:hypothetical protein [Tsuneonella flava]